jgi:hypothetical protein
MQILFSGRQERLYSEFKDSNQNLTDPSGSVLLSIQSADGGYILTDAEATREDVGRYYYEFTPDLGPGYYGVWWTGPIEGVYTTQDVPNPFKIEDPAEAVNKAVYLEGVRSKLYMHMDMGGFVNKFPRDREILDLMQNSLDWINAHPPTFTQFNFSNLPSQFDYLLEMGAVILALQSLGIFEAGKHFVYNDNGISLTRDRSGKYMSLYAGILQNYAASLKNVKTIFSMKQVKMHGLFSSTTGFPRSLSRALRGVSKFAS